MPLPIRYLCVDALRGLTVAAMLLVNNAGDWNHVHPLLSHAAWHGLQPADLIFPLFLFIVGVSAVMSLQPRLDGGTPANVLWREVILRGLRITALGIALHILAATVIDGRDFRLFGVLQRIGLCFVMAGLCIIALRPRALSLLATGLLISYGHLLTLGDSTPTENLAARVDSWLLGPLAYQFDPATGRAFDPEGLISTIGAFITTLLGARAGHALRQGDRRFLWLGGLGCLAAGWIAAQIQPINKALWTPTFVLVTGGFSSLLLALFHDLMDHRGWPAIGRAMGRNALAAYAGSWSLACLLTIGSTDRRLYQLLFGAIVNRYGDEAASAAWAIAVTALWWFLMRLCHARRWYWRM
ncbi:acyltransferase family protein [Tahibacter amnicola]|uniref:Heparan-alpha-glucosaminide N-acetyltransferase domain-containing protein n=1 Tax=Tahibacter amnicola TaxID=2976241 RepID=A0ABY6BC36_9GAMM|nr:heparan-alpha-glucosaminide N-acetyltransferase domain-containing protein [Tahibacter amnicola]UXI67117.1 heparan-alpha-glucosaminide N-acetyltransferase domain-containing protein [Tahibacter amnicola]